MKILPFFTKLIACLFLYFSLTVIALGDGTPENPYEIGTADDLISFGQNTDGYDKSYILTNDINLSGYEFSEAVIAPDADTSTMGFQGEAFSGTFDGNGFTITNLAIEPTGVRHSYLGLFGNFSGEIRNLGLEECSVVAGDYSNSIGALAGLNDYGVLANCYASGMVSSGYNSYHIGGLVGVTYGSISSSYSNCEVSLGNESFNSGGLYGYSRYSGIVSNCYAIGSVAGGESCSFIGGFCGINSYGSSISNSYSNVEIVTGLNSSNIGGFCGRNYVRTGISNSFWNIDNSGIATSSGGDGVTFSQMEDISTFIDKGWDFENETDNGVDDIWTLYPDSQHPQLAWQPGDLPGLLELSGPPDLACVFGDVGLPPAIVSNAVTKGKVQIIITNEAAFAIEKGTKISVVVSARPVWADGDTSYDIVLAEKEKVRVGRLKAGKRKKLKMKVIIKDDVPEDEYHLIATLDTDDIVTESDKSNNTAISESSVIVAQPFVDLVPDIVNPKFPDSLTFGDGKKIVLPVTICNKGNVTIDKRQDVDILVFTRLLSNLGDSSGDEILTELKNVPIPRLKSGKAKKLKIATYLPAGLPQGEYVLGVDIALSDNGVEGNEGNNMAMTSPMLIQEGYVNLTGEVRKGTLPIEILSGKGGQGAIKLRVTNQGNIAAAKGQKVDIKIIAKSTVNNSEWELNPTNKRSFSISGLKPGASKKYKDMVVIPSNIPEGTYQIITTIDSGFTVGESNENDNVINVQSLQISSLPN